MFKKLNKNKGYYYKIEQLSDSISILTIPL